MELDNCSGSGFWGDAHNIGTSKGPAGENNWWCQDLHIHGGGVYQNIARQGIVPNNIYNLLVENVTYSDIKRSFVDIEALGGYPVAGCINFTMRQVIANGIKNTFFTNGAFGLACHNIVLEDIQTDSVMAVIAGYGKIRPNYSIFVPPNGRVLAADKGRRGSYTFRRCVCTSGVKNNAGQPNVRGQGASSLIVEDCYMDKSSSNASYFAQVNENATYSISGNGGQNILGQYETVADPTLANGGLQEGYEAISDGMGGWMQGPNYIIEKFIDEPIPTGPPEAAPYF